MSNPELGNYLIIAMISMAISMALIPIMMRLAPVLGMIDKPDSRKVHSEPIPRVGGVGIVIGALVPMFIWLPMSTSTYSFLFGCAVLLIFGTWDDIKELGHYVKFVGQFIAVISVVYFGDLYVQHFPYIGLEAIPESIGKPFTVIALVGVINALNHSDGLDGLAGGEALLSFGAIAYLAYLYDGLNVLVIACATIGGIFGFLRFNSYPARVFMGDGGSQFIGFTVGVLAVLLTQDVNPVLSPALPLLLIGLPIMDILAVFFLRAKGRMNLFRATRNHIHHRLLELGFHHYESVMVIYSVQAFFVICAVLMPYENDYLITAIYLVTCGMVFTFLTISERFDFKLRHAHSYDQRMFSLPGFLANKNIASMPAHLMEASVAIFLVASALMSETIPADIGVAALMLLIMIIPILLVPAFANMLLLRLVVFISVGFSVYLLSSYPPAWLVEQNYLAFVYFAVLIIATFTVARLISIEKFHITPLDYLVLIIALIIGFVPDADIEGAKLTWMALQMIILFYACELIIQQINKVRSRFTGALVAALSLIAIRGLL